MPIRVYTNEAYLNRRFAELGEKSVNRISRNAVRRGLTVLRQAMRNAVPSSAKTTGHQTLSIKQAMGQSLKKSYGTDTVEGKAGAAVGIKASRAEKASAKRAGSARRGVGISANNVHWYILGTRLRHTGGRNRRGGVKLTNSRIRSTGVMPAQPAVRRGAAAAMGRAEQTIIESVRNQVLREWESRRAD